MESVKKSIDKRALHKREYDNRANERQMHTTKEKVDMSTTLDASLVDTKRNGTESKEHDTSSRPGNDTNIDDANIRPIYDKEPMAEVQTTAEINVFATGQHHTEQLEFNNEGEVDQNAKKGKPVLQPHRNQSVVRQPTAFKSERPRILKPRFASQVDMNKDLPKPVTSDYFPKERESAFAKPHRVITSSNFRNSLKNMPRFSSNDMVHNQYLAEAKNKTQDVGGKPERGKIFKTVVLRWVPTGKIFTSSTTKVNSEPTNGSNEDITNQYECEKLLMLV
ncbi:hypothetical protein Tco_0470725 [Tanacetum coccineum]